MRAWPWLSLVLLAAVTLSLPFLFGACSDDDDDDDNKDSDFDNMDDDSGDDDVSDDDSDDDTGSPDYTEDPPTGACSCGGPSCAGCASKMEMLEGAGLLDDFAGLNVDFGADEWGDQLGLSLDADVPVGDLICADGLFTTAVDCADVGVNCAFECDNADCYAACGERVFQCESAAEADYAQCARREQAVCAPYVDCALGCALQGDLTEADTCVASCSSTEPICDNLRDAVSSLACFAGMHVDVSLAETGTDLASVFERYAVCLP